MAKPRALIVDDEPAIRDAIAAVLEGTFLVRQAESAEAALAMPAANAFDVLLVDKNLPGKSGLDLIRAVREKDGEVAILLITGYSSQASARDALNLDVDAYLEKPFQSLPAVIELAQSAILRRRERRAASRAAPQKPGLSVVLAAAPVACDELARPIDPKKGSLRFATTEQDLLATLADPADVIVVDGSTFKDGTVAVVEKAVTRAPLATYAVVYGGELALPVLQRLIEIGVKGLFDAKTYPRAIDELLEKVLVRKQVLEGAPKA